MQRRNTIVVLLLCLLYSPGKGFQVRLPSSTDTTPDHGLRNSMRVPSVLFPLHALKESPSSEAKEPRKSQEGDGSLTRGIMSFVIQGLWKGVTLPFPALRQIVYRSDSSRQLSIGLSFREGLLALTAYLGLGVFCFSFILEKWSVVDSLYYSCVLLTTVGYGDLVPTTSASKAFSCLFGIGGIALLGTAVATVGGRFVQAEVEAVQKARQKSQKRLVRLFEGMPKALKSHRGKTQTQQHGALKDARRRVEKHLAKPYRMITAVKRALCQVVPSLAMITGGAVVMRYLNSAKDVGIWSLSDTLYYSLITSSTIGLGDLSPVTPAARIFAVLYIPLSVAAAGEILSGIAMTLIQRRQREVYAKQLENDLTIQHLQAMDTDGDGQITKFEYVQFMLLEMGRISTDEMNELLTQFERLDVTRSGYLDNEDLKLMAELRGARVVDKSSK